MLLLGVINKDVKKSMYPPCLMLTEIQPSQPILSDAAGLLTRRLFTEAWGGPCTAGRRGQARGDSTAEDKVSRQVPEAAIG